MKGALAGIIAAATMMEGQNVATGVSAPRFKGIVLPQTEWKRRKSRMRMQKTSRKANRK